MLRRNDLPPDSFKEQTQAQDQPIRSLIVIGASAGGPAAIGSVLKGLSRDVPAAIVVMLHVPHDSAFDMAKWFQRFGHIEIVETRPKERLREGIVFVAPPGQSLRVQEGELSLEALNPRVSSRDTINQLFESSAQAYGDRVIGVILSGLLADGSKGLRAVHEGGGLTVIQNPVDSRYQGMTSNALASVPEATFRLNATDIGLALDLLARRNAELETGLSSAVRHLKERIALLVRLLMQSRGNEATYRYLSMELKSLREDLRSVEDLLSESR
ncbi:chemotaxis protein CheB [Nitrospira sp. Nam74]